MLNMLPTPHTPPCTAHCAHATHAMKRRWVERGRFVGGDESESLPPGPDRVYVNLACINGGAASTAANGLGAPVVFTETRTANILDHANDYALSIMRWSSTGVQLPVFVPAISSTAASADDTPYKIGLVVTGEIDSAWPGATVPSSTSTVVILYAAYDSNDETLIIWPGDNPGVANVGDTVVLTVTPVGSGGADYSELLSGIYTVVPSSYGYPTYALKKKDGNALPSTLPQKPFLPSGIEIVPTAGDAAVHKTPIPAAGGVIVWGQGAGTDIYVSNRAYETQYHTPLHAATGYVLADFTGDYAFLNRGYIADGNTTATLVSSSAPPGFPDDTVVGTRDELQQQGSGFLNSSDVVYAVESGTPRVTVGDTVFMSLDGDTPTATGVNSDHGYNTFATVISKSNNVFTVRYATAIAELAVTFDAVTMLNTPNTVLISMPYFSELIQVNSSVRLDNVNGNTAYAGTIRVYQVDVAAKTLYGRYTTTPPAPSFVTQSAGATIQTNGRLCKLQLNISDGTTVNAVRVGTPVNCTALTAPANYTQNFDATTGYPYVESVSTSTNEITIDYGPSAPSLPGTGSTMKIYYNNGTLTYGNINFQPQPVITPNACVYNTVATGGSIVASDNQQEGQLNPFSVHLEFQALDVNVTPLVPGGYLSIQDSLDGSRILPLSVPPFTGRITSASVDQVTFQAPFVDITPWLENFEPLTTQSGVILAINTQMTYVFDGTSERSFAFIAPLKWRPQYTNESVPLPPALNGGYMDFNEGSRYYWATDEAHWLNIVNEAIADLQDTADQLLFQQAGISSTPTESFSISAVSVQSTTSIRLTVQNAEQSVITDNGIGIGNWVYVYGNTEYVNGLWQVVDVSVNFYSSPPNTEAFVLLFDGNRNVTDQVYQTGSMTFVPVNLNRSPQFVSTGGGNLQLLYSSSHASPNKRTFQTPALQIQMNAQLYELFRGFAARCSSTPNEFLSTVSDDAAEANLWESKDVVYTLDMLTPMQFYAQAGPTYDDTSPIVLKLDTSYPCTDAWSPVAALLIDTQLPIVPEEQSAPSYAGGAFAQSATRDSSTSMTDVALELAGGATDWMQKINYTPTAQYRWTQLSGTGPIQNIKFQLYWRARFNNARYVATLAPGGSVEIKLLFQRV